MALADEVTSRYSAAQILGLTNPQDSSAASNGTTKLNAAVTDVTARFAMVGITYDNTVATHVSVAVEGVVALLRLRTGQYEGAKDEWADFLKALDALRMVTSNNRISPKSTSELTPTDENPDDNNTTRPAFDRSEFADLIPGSRAVDLDERLNL